MNSNSVNSARMKKTAFYFSLMFAVALSLSGCTESDSSRLTGESAITASCENHVYTNESTVKPVAGECAVYEIASVVGGSTIERLSAGCAASDSAPSAAEGSAPAAAPSGSPAAGGSASSTEQRPSSDGASAGNGSDSQPAAKPSHEHSWNAVTEQRWFVDQAAWDEDVYKTNIVCDCGLSWSSTNAWFDHCGNLLDAGGSGCGYQSKPIYVNTVHHEEVGHYETVTTGYKCSCGATK